MFPLHSPSACLQGYWADKVSYIHKLKYYQPGISENIFFPNTFWKQLLFYLHSLIRKESQQNHWISLNWRPILSSTSFHYAAVFLDHTQHAIVEDATRWLGKGKAINHLCLFWFGGVLCFFFAYVQEERKHVSDQEEGDSILVYTGVTMWGSPSEVYAILYSFSWK